MRGSETSSVGPCRCPRRHLGWTIPLGLILLALLVGCELAEVAAPAGDDVLAVEAVLRVGAERQYVLLHRSMVGTRVRGEPGASVSVTDGSGHVVEYQETAIGGCITGDPTTEWDIDDLELDASCYLSPIESGRFVRPGETYELRVETARGEIVRGRTTVPGATEFRSPAVEVDSASREVRCQLPTEPFELVWTRSEGAWAYILTLQLAGWGDELREQGIDVPDPLDLTSVSVSAADTTVQFPQNIGLFQRFDLDQRIFAALDSGVPAGTDATLVVLATDRNYTNAIRGGSFNPSGSIRGASVVGDGVGVFGSVVPLIIRSGAIGETPPTECALPSETSR